jgi:DNA-binding transcriptional ArsR family regulator
MHLVKKQRNETFSLPCRELSPAAIKSVSSGLAQRILRALAEGEAYPRALAQQLHVHEQKVYYHIRKLEKAGIIHVVRTETRHGAVVHYYGLVQPSFAVRFKDFQHTQKLASYSNESDFLEPFIRDGQLDALIVVGSPDPHGPEKARSRDGYYGMDLALFLGTFLNYIPGLNVRLDTEVRDADLKKNLIVIGGPIVNAVAGKINSRLPIRFTAKSIKSTLSGEEYFSDEVGVIVKAVNPFDKTKQILFVAGRRHSGTRACMVAFLKRFKEVAAGNIHNAKVFAKVVEGVDLDSDGVVDDVEVRE